MADHLTSLKRARSENSDTVLGAPDEDAPFFPVGVHFSSPELEKLGLENAKIGDKMTMISIITVTSIHANESMKGKMDRSVGFDMLEAEVSKEGKSQAETLFGED